MRPSPQTLVAALCAACSLLAPSFARAVHADSPAAVLSATYADGDLVQASGDDKIHIIRGGQRHWIADTLSLQQVNPDFSRLKQLSIDELRAIPAGKPIHAGPVIRDSANGQIFLLTKETDWPAARKHWINDLDSFTKLGFQWEDVDVSWSTPPSRYAYAPALTFVPVSREPAPLSTPEGAFTVIPAWRLQTQDDRLLRALAVAYSYNPDWRAAIAGQIATGGAWIEWGSLPTDVGGLYSDRANRITVSQALQGESLGVIASTLTHEAVHAVTKHGTDATACFAEEATAFSYEARTWANIPANLRSTSAQAKFLDALVELFKAKGVAGIQQIVSQEPAYQHECDVNATSASHPLPLD